MAVVCAARAGKLRILSSLLGAERRKLEKAAIARSTVVWSRVSCVYAVEVGGRNAWLLRRAGRRRSFSGEVQVSYFASSVLSKEFLAHSSTFGVEIIIRSDKNRTRLPCPPATARRGEKNRRIVHSVDK